jgi:glyceraldehyde 3-phosphate dehydrogenase
MISKENFSYDSTYGRFPGEIETTPDSLIVNGHTVNVISQQK